MIYNGIYRPRPFLRKTVDYYKNINPNLYSTIVYALILCIQATKYHTKYVQQFERM